MKLLHLRTNVLSGHVQNALPFVVYTVGTERQPPMTRLGGFSAHQLILTWSGRGKFRLLGQQEWDILDAGTVLFMPADIPHEYVPDGTEPWLIGFVSFTAAPEALQAWRLGHEPKRIAVEAADRLFALLEQIWSCSGADQDSWLSAELYLAILTEISKQHSLASPEDFSDRQPEASYPDTVVLAATRFLQDHLSRRTSIADLAEQMGYSQKQLTRMFLQAYRITPLQYLKRMRIQNAALLLRRNPGMNVAEIAAHVGMEPVYFARSFRAAFGVTPTEFRQQP